MAAYFGLGFLVTLVAANEILPDVCDPITIKCMKTEGDSCHVSNANSCGAGSVDGGTCRVCDDGMICHERQCVFQSVLAGGACCDDSAPDSEACIAHLFCAPGSQCNGGECSADRNAVNSKGFAERGRDCREDADCAPGTGFYCDPNNKCELPESMNIPGTRIKSCSSHDQCYYGQYCALADSGDGSAQRTCQAILTDEEKLNSPCVANEHCGHGWLCLATHPHETSERFQDKRCVKPFLRGEGESCSAAGGIFSDAYCKRDLFCHTTGTCRRANMVYNGIGCAEDSECGLGMTCACPQLGGGRQRCAADPNIALRKEYLKLWDTQQKFYECLIKNECQMQLSAQGACSYPCLPEPTVAPDQCRFISDNLPGYMGVDFSSAGSVGASMLVTAVAAAAALTL